MVSGEVKLVSVSCSLSTVGLLRALRQRILSIQAGRQINITHKRSFTSGFFHVHHLWCQKFYSIPFMLQTHTCPWSQEESKCSGVCLGWSRETRTPPPSQTPRPPSSGGYPESTGRVWTSYTGGAPSATPSSSPRSSRSMGKNSTSHCIQEVVYVFLAYKE